MATYEYKSLGEYKDLLFKLLTLGGERCKDKSELLIEIIMPTLDDDRFDKYENFLGGEYEYYNKGTLEYVKLQGRIFDVPFIYSTVLNTINVICIDTNIARANPNTKTISVTLDIMCHKDNLELDTETKRKFRKLGYKGNRLDIMVALIGEILNYSRECNLGIGTLMPYPNNPVSSYFPNQNFFGKVMKYTCDDFMIDYSERSLNNE